MIEKIALVGIVLFLTLVIYGIIKKINKKPIPLDMDIPIVRTSQYKGVYYDQTKQRWKSGITINKVRYTTGSFKTEQEAYYALEQLKSELNFEK